MKALVLSAGMVVLGLSLTLGLSPRPSYGKASARGHAHAAKRGGRPHQAGHAGGGSHRHAAAKSRKKGSQAHAAMRLPHGPSSLVAHPSALDKVALNPQPLPPGGAALFNSGRINPGVLSSLNPQPLPPRNAALFNSARINPGVLSSLNPQPLPPGNAALFNSGRVNPGVLSSLNPQPLPPRVLTQGGRGE